MATLTLQESIQVARLYDWAYFGLQYYYLQDTSANTTTVYVRPYLRAYNDSYLYDIKIPDCEIMVDCYIDGVHYGDQYYGLGIVGNEDYQDIAVYESIAYAASDTPAWISPRYNTGIVIEHDVTGSLPGAVTLTGALTLSSAAYTAIVDSTGDYLGTYNYTQNIYSHDDGDGGTTITPSILAIDRSTRLNASKTRIHRVEKTLFDIYDTSFQAGTATYTMRYWRIGDEDNVYIIDTTELYSTNEMYWSYDGNYSDWLNNPWFGNGETRAMARFELTTWYNGEEIGTNTIDIEVYDLTYGVMTSAAVTEDDSVTYGDLPAGSHIRGYNKYEFYCYAAPVPDGNTQVISVVARYNTTETITLAPYTGPLANGEDNWYAATAENLFSENVRFEITYWTDGEGSNRVIEVILRQTELTDYIGVSCAGEADGPISGAGETSFTINGNYFNNVFPHPTTGTYINNSLALTYTLGCWDDNTSSSSVKITPVLSLNSYSATVKLTGLDYKKHYYVIVIAKDKVLTSSVLINISGTPIFDWSHEDFHFNIPVHMSENLVLDTNAQIVGWDAENQTTTSVFLSRNSNGDTILGQGNYDNAHGNTLIYGNAVDIMAHNGVTINGKWFGNQDVLWDGAEQMDGSTTIELSDSAASMHNGIILVFSLYGNSIHEDKSLHSFYISKREIELFPNAPHTFMLGVNAAFSTVGAKYLYISQSSISGDDSNISSGTGASGITFNNSSFVLRYVLGF